MDEAKIRIERNGETGLTVRAQVESVLNPERAHRADALIIPDDNGGWQISDGVRIRGSAGTVEDAVARGRRLVADAVSDMAGEERALVARRRTQAREIDAYLERTLNEG